MNIENKQIAELAEALAAIVPTAESIRNAIALAYRAGRNDGAIEACNNMLAKFTKEKA